MGISGEICACLLPGKWWQLIYLSLYIGESLLILYEDYKKLFKLQATLCTMLLVENQQMENISAFWGKGVVRKMNRYKGRRGWRYRAKTPLSWRGSPNLGATHEVWDIAVVHLDLQIQFSGACWKTSIFCACFCVQIGNHFNYLYGSLTKLTLWVNSFSFSNLFLLNFPHPPVSSVASCQVLGANGRSWLCLHGGCGVLLVCVLDSVSSK